MISISNDQNSSRLSFAILSAAARGDIDAINQVVDHFDGYITSLSTLRSVGNSNKLRFYVDEDMRRHLQTKLITKILQFKLV